jgi:hypothetical protein
MQGMTSQLFSDRCSARTRASRVATLGDAWFVRPEQVSR